MFQKWISSDEGPDKIGGYLASPIYDIEYLNWRWWSFLIFRSHTVTSMLVGWLSRIAKRRKKIRSSSISQIFKSWTAKILTAEQKISTEQHGFQWSTSVLRWLVWDNWKKKNDDIIDLDGNQVLRTVRNFILHLIVNTRPNFAFKRKEPDQTYRPE